MWTVENRARYDRSRLRYPSDMTDEEWTLAKPQIPRAKRGGNKRTVDIREVVNGLMYILSTGCQWRALPKDLPPRSTVNHYFCRWQHDGTLDRLHHALYVRCREQADRDGGLPLMAMLFGLYPFLLKLYADAGYQGRKFQRSSARVCRDVNVEIVRRCDKSKFVVLPKRWIVECTIAWLNRCRRLSKDWECLNRNALAFFRWASIRMMLRRLCQG